MVGIRVVINLSSTEYMHKYYTLMEIRMTNYRANTVYIYDYI